MSSTNSYHARVEENGNGIIHSIITWKPDAVLTFLGQYHVSKTKLTFTLYPIGETPRIIPDPKQVYAILQEDITEDPCASC